MLRYTIYSAWLLFFVLSIACGVAWADEPPTLPNTKQKIADWIAQLKNEHTAVRDEASRNLIDMGLSAKPQLETISQGIDSPFRRRARWVLAGIEREAKVARFEASLKAFAEGASNVSLPGWKEYSRCVGDDHNTRSLFLAMYRAEPKLPQLYENNLKGAEDLLLKYAFSQSMSTMLARLALAWLPGSVPSESPEISAGLAATSLLLAGDERVEEPWGFGFLVNDPKFIEALEGSEYQEPMKKLLGRWINHPSERVLGDKRGHLGSDSCRPRVEIALRFDLKAAALAFANRLLLALDTGNEKYGLRVICVLGDRQHIKTVEPLLDDRGACNKVPVALKGTVQVQLRDLALATLVQITGQKWDDYKLKCNDPDRKDKLLTVYFENDADRDHALAKWQGWSKENLKRK